MRKIVTCASVCAKIFRLGWILLLKIVPFLGCSLVLGMVPVLKKLIVLDVDACTQNRINIVLDRVRNLLLSKSAVHVLKK